jgi:aminoglycoside phosphotransferase (APT) family kinase protein
MKRISILLWRSPADWSIYFQRNFPSPESLPKRTVIWHDDLSLSNILVDEGIITAVLDWECVCHAAVAGRPDA